eukprot:GHVU01026008.1.p1 GENE.GHVU01026008.1~~GHVU01026008.1.p1  ORF type:complete len:138 (+),score=22.53 GHVU01026008.1:2-415(+)
MCACMCVHVCVCACVHVWVHVCPCVCACVNVCSTPHVMVYCSDLPAAMRSASPMGGLGRGPMPGHGGGMGMGEEPLLGGSSTRGRVTRVTNLGPEPLGGGGKASPVTAVDELRKKTLSADFDNKRRGLKHLYGVKNR